jgi:glutamate 5-kinase
MVCDGGPLLMRAWMQQVSQLRKKFGIDVIWVTSGAIAWAAQKTDFKKAKRSLPQKQALSAIGQPLIMDQYNLALAATGLLGAQVLLTAGDMGDGIRRKNLQNTLQELLRWRVIPILNENDAVATDEIRFGDNDTLAAQVAIMMNAERLILMTDVDGLFKTDPSKHPNAELIPYRKKLMPADLKLAPVRSKSSVGTGGMYSKLKASQKSSRSGIITHLVRGDWPNNLLEIANHRPIGTQIGGKV